MFFSIMMRFSLVFFGAISYILLARIFAKGDSLVQMNYWSLFTVTTATIELTKGGLLRNAFIKYLHSVEFIDNKAIVQSSSLFINASCTLLVILAIVFGGGWFAHFLKAPPLENLFYWSCFLFIALVPFNHYEIILQANFQFQLNFYAYMIRQGSFFLYMLLGAIFFPAYITFDNLLLVQILGVVGADIYMYIKCRPYLSGKLIYNSAVIKKLLGFGKFVFGTALFANVSRSVDQLVTANIMNNINVNAVSYYNVVSRVSNMMDSPTTAAADILFPKNAQASELEGNAKVKYYFERMVATLTALIIPIGLFIFVFPKFVVMIIAGPKYYPAIPILQLMAISSFIRPFIFNFGHTVDAIGKPRTNFLVNVALMILNTAITYFCLIQFGLMGAAYATFAVNAITFLGFYLILRKVLNIELKNIAVYTKLTYINLFHLVRKILFKQTVSV
ncbi:oligosaccharide flippase family protein [Pinibacter soli]|nr:oligosaccharide flippase family protein [Pinibacter soli]